LQVAGRRTAAKRRERRLLLTLRDAGAKLDEDFAGQIVEPRFSGANERERAFFAHDRQRFRRLSCWACDEQCAADRDGRDEQYEMGSLQGHRASTPRVYPRV
jgi:hypothetical protein